MLNLRKKLRIEKNETNKKVNLIYFYFSIDVIYYKSILIKIMPPKHKGVSLQEKRDRILKIFTEKKEVFSLGQIEKEAEKAGIRRDQVKDLLEALVSDTLVEVDTIGNSKVYWSLPSQTYIRI